MSTSASRPVSARKPRSYSASHSTGVDETDANEPEDSGEFPESFGGSTRSHEADAASAAASDTAAALAQLARHASTHHGPAAAADVLAIAAARFPKRRFPDDVAVDDDDSFGDFEG